MQTRREKLGYGMTLMPSLEELVPTDHPLRRLDRVLNLDFIHDAVADKYCPDNGRPSIDPEVVIRLFLLQAIEGIVHVRDLMRQVQVNLAYRWFIGYGVDEKLPDHSTLSKALDRLGGEVFDELFSRSISQCKKSGLIEGKVLHVDATTIRADLDVTRVNKADSPDRDARFGRFPDGKIRPGYKQHTVADGKNRVVLDVSVTAANGSEHDEAVSVIDEAVARLDAPPEAVCADGAYASGENKDSLNNRGIRLVSPPAKARKATCQGKFTVEDFVYEESDDVYVCPAGERLTFRGFDSTRPGRREYMVSGRPCRHCPYRSRCTTSNRRRLRVGPHHQSLNQLRADSQTESFKKLYRSRAPVIEGVFAEAKQWHGLRRAWRRGLSKMRVQCLLIASVLNFKRLAAVFLSLLVDLCRFIMPSDAHNRDQSHKNPFATGFLAKLASIVAA
ncbi:MAG: IS1182 family transposase [Candidatus Zixiibacteriota bacterium]